MPYAVAHPKNCVTCQRPITHKATKCRPCNCSARRGENHPSWIGDAAKPQTGRARAKKLYPLQAACERCGKSGCYITRHHKDRNPLNNEDANIEQLCMSCHRYEHERTGW